jgi:nanoRNase/pAp phosphatase (c-di-AMP/oligoRNAs hydrolase)
MMETPFPKSISFDTKYKRLLEVVNSSDTLGILINADPDSMASAMALKRLVLFRDIAFVHMERVDNPDILILIADFFMKIAEIQWSIVSGVYKKNLVVILRNASFQEDAGKTARILFGRWGGYAGGYRNAARAEIPLENILDDPEDESGFAHFVKKR